MPSNRARQCFARSRALAEGNRPNAHAAVQKVGSQNGNQAIARRNCPGETNEIFRPPWIRSYAGPVSGLTT